MAGDLRLITSAIKINNDLERMGDLAVNITEGALRLMSEPAVRPRDLELFRKVVRGAFAYRRKTLANSLTLALDLPREQIVAAIASLALNPDVRGEDLDLRTFAALTDALAG